MERRMGSIGISSPSDRRNPDACSHHPVGVKRIRPGEATIAASP
jgi:hypothetical protein